MGIQTMGSQSNGQQSLLQPSPLVRQNSWYSLTLNEVENQLGNLGKPLGSMNLDELLDNVWSTELNPPLGMNDTESISSSSSSLQRQASLTLARALSGKTVDQVWSEIQQGQKRRYGEGIKDQEREATLGETTLEDFLVQAGLFVAETSLDPTMEFDNTRQQSLPHQFGLSPTPSIGTLSDTPMTGQKRDVFEKSIESLPQQFGLSPTPSIGTLSDTPMTGRKRDAQDAFEKSIERRLRRKIKNRESAARSRARKQARAYHNELVNKVSRLEEDSLKLKREKEFDTKSLCETSETRYQLRRTSSASF
ncbi:hypothetical protein Gohar_001843 [Gossypium harknessii]|uniref:BZIP domain-containing protein n=1 Tax=Gossypium harknessii TaxID=34285 RepID=A0A7J9I560_9ROSI|nr:hypothetical protein [Gossypium harknessii]